MNSISTMKYGDYDPDSGEYVIRRPDTPQPWHNYLTNGHFTSYVSGTGGGTCFCEDAQNRRILRTHIHSRPIDHPGRWIYLRDTQTGKFWSVTWAPTYNELTAYEYECRIGAGYTTIMSSYRKITTALTYFVPLSVNCEIWSFEISNMSQRKRVLDIFPYCEFMLWSQRRDMNLDAGFKCTDIIAENNAIIHRSMYDFQGEDGGWRRQYACFASSARVRTFDVLMDSFIGPYSGYHAPAAVMNGHCSNYVNRGGHPCAGMQIRIALNPGKSRRISFILGYATSERLVKSLAIRCADLEWVDKQFFRLNAHWHRYLNNFQAHTGDPCFDVPFNKFLPVQCRMTFLLSRSISPYQLSGSRGLGFRDSIQDTIGAIAHQSRNAKKLIRTLLACLRPEGDACHTFYPAEGIGEGTGYWDDHLWPALAVSWYVRETGDLEFLQEEVPYWQSPKHGTVLEHLERALQFSERMTGRNGLPLLGSADWNDCLNAYPGAESVFTACLYCYAIREVERLVTALGNHRKAKRMHNRFEQMAELINRYCWDGEWYTRLILKDGTAVGSRKNRYGKIFIESNVWAVMSGVATGQRAVLTLDSIRRHLGTPYGFRLCVPPYPDYDPSVGSISIFPPGLKENGSIFCHTNPWVVCAEAAVGRGKMAYDAFRLLSPYTKNQIQSYHCAEPYVVSQMIVMPPSKEVGRAHNPWLTGTASWLYVAMAEAILGIRADFEGLRIDPCVPEWEAFDVIREFREVKYEIQVRNPGRVEKGVRSITVNGEMIEGNVVHAVPGKRRVRVRVLMGPTE